MWVRKIKVKDIAFLAIFLAIAIILNFATLQFGTVFRFNFFSLPLIIVGILYGPIIGAGFGLVADGFNTLISANIYSPFFALQNVFLPFLFGLIFFTARNLPKKGKIIISSLSFLAFFIFLFVFSGFFATQVISINNVRIPVWVTIILNAIYSIVILLVSFLMARKAKNKLTFLSFASASMLGGLVNSFIFSTLHYTIVLGVNLEAFLLTRIFLAPLTLIARLIIMYPLTLVIIKTFKLSNQEYEINY